VSKLRADVYNVLDRIAETGEPVEIERKGVTLRIIVERRESLEERLAKIRKPDLWVGDPK
jgi:hypothetical protein